MDPEHELDKRHPATGVLATMGGAVAVAAGILGLALLVS